MSTTITGSQNINNKGTPSYRNPLQEEKDIDRRPINGNVSMEVFPSKRTVNIGTDQGAFSFSAECNNDSPDSPKLSKTTLSFFDRDARWGVFGGAYSSDSSEKVYKNFLGGVLKSKLGTFTSEIHTRGQYSLRYSTKGTWIGDLLVQQIDFMITAEMSFIEDNDIFSFNTIMMLGWHINEQNIAGSTFEVSADRRVHSLFYEGSLYEASYGNLIFKPSISFEDSKYGSIQFAVSLLTRFQAKP